jgi:phosphoglycolate phosphatase
LPSLILFDFDGTLADSMQAGVEIFNTLSDEFGFRPIEADGLSAARAMSARQLMKEHGIPLASVPKIAARGLKLLRIRMESIDPFPGIPEALVALRKQGFTIGLLTSNSKENVEAFLQQHQLPPFDFISPSSRLFGKAHDLQKILRKRKLKPDDVIYIGDECRDLEAAREVGIPAIGVTWGFNTAEALGGLEPAALLNHPSEIPRFFADSHARISPSQGSVHD